MKKIMFNDKYGMEEAVLEKLKEITRRDGSKTVLQYEIGFDIRHDKNGKRESLIEYALRKCPYKVGDVVAIAQAYKVLDYTFHNFATNPSRSCGIRKEYAEKQKGWSNKMFVEAKFMPHHIYITDIKVERLQDISDEDCMKEGIYEDAEEHGGLYTTPFYDFYGNEENGFYEPREAFAALIDKVCGKGTWNKNPWVFAYSFELID